MRDNRKLLEGLRELNIDLSEDQIKQFELYYELLIEWNSVMNLTSITEYDEVLIKHFLDSLVLCKVIDTKKQSTLIDMGTGAGFPGIPLKIAHPNLDIVLMDSLNKRVKFLNEVISKLGLKNIKAVHGRAEELGRAVEYREQFDICVSRAVAKLFSLSEFCLPFVKKNGYFIPYKSGKIEEELIQSEYAIKVLGGKLEKQEGFLLPNTDVERTLLVIKKTKETPKSYPRAGGKPLKAPLMNKN